MTAKDLIQSKYPTAACYGREWDGYKIYHGEARIALSVTKPTADEAWADAAQALQAREEAKP